MDRASYLERIGYTGDLTPTADTLRRLHEAHLMTVPFENLDIHLGRPIVLDETLFYDKIVSRRRGGYCYELNGLFAWLLQDLGFDVTLISAGVYSAEHDRYGPDGDHLCLLVTMDQRWLADVGFGDSFLRPMSLDDQAEHVDGKTAYRLAAEGDDWIMSSRAPEADWVPQYRFMLRPRRMYDFTYANHFMQTSPDTNFTKKRVCTLARPDGRITISDMRFIETTNGTRVERELESSDERDRLLAELFGISLDRSITNQ